MDFENLHQILRSLYDEMMPLCSDMTDIAKGLAGLGALFYVALRVWQSLSRAEPIDVFPLLRPFAIGLAIMFFPTIVLGTLNSVMSPIVQGTHSMLETQTFDMNEYRAQKDKLEYEAMKRNPETAYLVSNEEFDKQLDELGWSPGDVVTMAGMYVERGMYSMKKSIRDFFRELLELLFQAAALVIDVLRTFFLIVLSILGPLCFAISVWDGFQSTLTQWFCRYIQIYLWLPVSDLFSTILAKIQVLMLQNDIEALQNDPNFSIEASNGVYIVFLIIGIISYDNSLLPDEELTYTPYYTWTTEFKDTEGNVKERTAHAALMFSRLIWHPVAENDKNAILTITNKTTGEEVARINLADFLAQGRGAFEARHYSEQEFLDREYDYKLDFFLQGNQWKYVQLSISILDWSKRIQRVDF